MKIKLIALSLAVVLAFSCFAGCKKDDGTLLTTEVSTTTKNLPDGLSDGYYNGKYFEFETIDGWQTQALSDEVFVMNTPQNSTVQAMITVSISESGGTKTTDLTWEKFHSEMTSSGFEVGKYQFGLTQLNEKDCLLNEYSMTADGQTYYVKAYFFDVKDSVVAIQMNVSEKGAYYSQLDKVTQSFIIK